MIPPEFPDRRGEWITVHLPVDGVRCLSCVLRLESALEDVPGVLEACVDIADADAAVRCRPGTVSREDLVRAVAGAGYRVATPAENGETGR